MYILNNPWIEVNVYIFLYALCRIPTSCTHTNTRKAHSKFNLKSAQEENFYFSVQCDEKISFSRDMFFL